MSLPAPARRIAVLLLAWLLVLGSACSEAAVPALPEDAVVEKVLDAARQGRCDQMRELLDHHRFPNDDSRLAPVFLYLGHARKLQGCDEQFYRRLSVVGADHSYFHKAGITPLGTSVLSGNMELANYLIDAGARVSGQHTSVGDCLVCSALPRSDNDLDQDAHCYFVQRWFEVGGVVTTDPERRHRFVRRLDSHCPDVSAPVIPMLDGISIAHMAVSAARNGHADVLRNLLLHGLDPNAAVFQEIGCPLNTALFFRRDKAAEVLRAHGAETCDVNDNNRE